MCMFVTNEWEVSIKRVEEVFSGNQLIRMSPYK